MRFTALLALALLGCTSSIRRPDSTQVVVTGTITAGGSDARGDRLAGVRVTLRDASGKALATSTTSSSGGYRLETAALSADPMVLVAEAEGFAPIARSMRVGRSTEMTISAALTPLITLECVDGLCAAPLVDVEWSSPPEAAAGSVAGFDEELAVTVPVDSTGSSFTSLVYVTLQNATDGTLFIRVPPRAWSQLRDEVPGTDAIEVSVAHFDVSTASWKRLAPAVLRSEAELQLPEGVLPAIASGTHRGGVIVGVPVVSAGFLGVLGRAPSRGCVTATITVGGAPAEGATVRFGHEPASSSNERGVICASAALSEVEAELQYAGLAYRSPVLEAPTATGVCGGTCTELGTIELEQATLSTAALCTVTGQVVDANGVGVPNVGVVAQDDSVPNNAVVAFCGQLGTRCVSTAPTAFDGSFSLEIPVMRSVLVAARGTITQRGVDALRSGALRVRGCPAEPVVLQLDNGLESLDVTVTLSGSSISWSPPSPASRVMVLAADGTTRWELVSAVGLSAPVPYGVQAPASEQRVTAMGPLSSGDTVLVELEGVSAQGLVFSGAGSAMVP